MTVSEGLFFDLPRDLGPALIRRGTFSHLRLSRSLARRLRRRQGGSHFSLPADDMLRLQLGLAAERNSWQVKKKKSYIIFFSHIVRSCRRGCYYVSAAYWTVPQPDSRLGSETIEPRQQGICDADGGTNRLE